MPPPPFRLPPPPLGPLARATIASTLHSHSGGWRRKQVGQVISASLSLCTEVHRPKGAVETGPGYPSTRRCGCQPAAAVDNWSPDTPPPPPQQPSFSSIVSLSLASFMVSLARPNLPPPSNSSDGATAVQISDSRVDCYKCKKWAGASFPPIAWKISDLTLGALSPVLAGLMSNIS